MDMGIANKTALVMASSRGLGFGTALALAKEGCQVAMCARRAKVLEQAADAIRRQVPEAKLLTQTCDVLDESAREQLIHATAEQLGPVDILVANAGGPPPGVAQDQTLDDYRSAFELNAISSIHMTSLCLPAMKQNQWGRVVMITSVSVKQPIANLALSNVARAGLTGYMKTLAREVASDGITVNAALPGFHDTDRMLNMLPEDERDDPQAKQKLVEEIAKGIPAGQAGNEEDFGQVVAFLCSQQARYITGSNLLVDGGSYQGLL